MNDEQGLTAPSGEPPAVELIGLDKRFGAVHANRAVDLSVAAASIHGIVGENGAGKTTLMNILYGLYQADAGEIRVRGEPVEIKDSQAALKAGIGMVHQHFMLVDNFTVLENIVLGAERGLLLEGGFAAARRVLAELEADYALKVDLDAVIADLPVGVQQRVEILKALYRGARVLILDEPTSVLTPQETDDLFRVLRRLRAEGKSIILITHKLQEIMAVTDRVTVMRDGAVVETLATRGTTREHLAQLMVGREVLLRVEKGAATPGAAVLEVDNLSVIDEAGVTRVQGVSFAVRAGEIVGIAGVSGNGQSELLEVLAGLRRPTSGRVRYGGHGLAVPHGMSAARALRRMGVVHVPEDRLRRGLVKGFEAHESAILGYQDDPAYNDRVLIDRPAILAHCAHLMAAFDVRPADPRLGSGALSGGNQQKLVLAREIERDPRLLLIGQPTRGVDIGAIEFIHRRLIELRDAGKAILLVSAELEEILGLADRILVMCAGRIVGELSGPEAEPRRIGLMMAGIEAAANPT